MRYWLMKSEPSVVGIDHVLAMSNQTVDWWGVRNYQARNNLREMKKGDWVLWYHSNEGKEIVGIAKVVKEHYQDPTTIDPNWVAVDLAPVKKLKKPVNLAQIKADKRLQNIALVKQGRLSVIPIKPEEFDILLEHSERK